MRTNYNAAVWRICTGRSFWRGREWQGFAINEVQHFTTIKYFAFKQRFGDPDQGVASLLDDLLAVS